MPKILFYLLIFTALLSNPFIQADEQAELKPKPNLIYILLDDAGFGDISCYGQQKFSTPNIDSLATDGMKFTDHYSGSTVCAPSRCALITGLHTGHCYVRGNREAEPEGQAPMPADTASIPRLLKKAGYITGAFGKWGLGLPGSTSDPMEHFDRFYGYNCQRLAHDYYPDHLWSDREKTPLDGKTYAHDLINDQTLQFVRDHHDKPFFAFVPITIPHAAMQVPEPYAEPFRKKYPKHFENKVSKYAGTTVKNPVAAFAGMMTKLDEDIGKLLSLLKELEIDDNTVILFTSDNGPHKEGGHKPDFFDSNGVFTGHKRDLTEGGIRTFLLARWPGVIEAASTSDHVSAHWDVLPTFCELAGVETPAEIDGISMVPTLTGGKDQQQHEYLYWEFYETGGKKAARWQNWKAVQTGISKDPDAPIRIYDLSADKAEKVNLADSKPLLVARAKAIFTEAHTPNPEWSWNAKSKNKIKDKP